MAKIILSRTVGNRKKNPIQEDGEELDMFLDRFVDNIKSIENKFTLIEI